MPKYANQQQKIMLGPKIAIAGQSTIFGALRATQKRDSSRNAAMRRELGVGVFVPDAAGVISKVVGGEGLNRTGQARDLLEEGLSGGF